MRKTVNKICGKGPHFKIQHVKITITVTSNCYYSKQSWLMTLSHKRCWLGLGRFHKQIISTLRGKEENLVIRKIESSISHSKPDISLLGSIRKASIDGFSYLLSEALTTVVALFGFRIFFLSSDGKFFIYRNPSLYKPFENGNLFERRWCNRCWRCVQFIWRIIYTFQWHSTICFTF